MHIMLSFKGVDRISKQFLCFCFPRLTLICNNQDVEMHVITGKEALSIKIVVEICYIRSDHICKGYLYSNFGIGSYISNVLSQS